MESSKLNEFFHKHPLSTMLLALSIFTVMLFTGFKIFYHYQPSVASSEAIIKQMLVSQRKQDTLLRKDISNLKDSLKANSTLATNTIAQINSLPSILSNLNAKYEKQNRTIAALPLDSRVEFFAEWLSEEDSTQQ